MAGDWRINAEERARYETYFQQCSPMQGYLEGEQAREFFVKSHLSGDILRKIWDLADVTADGRLDLREFIIACHLIASQVQKKGTLPATLPPSLLSDSITTTNGVRPTTGSPLTTNSSNQHIISNQYSGPILITTSLNNTIILTPAIRSKYIQQFHTLVDVSKTNGLMSGLQAKNILQQTGLSHILLHQIWNLADNDKDGCLTPDEFVIAMHCCDIARTGQPLPTHFPDEWLVKSHVQNERKDSLSKSNDNRTVGNLNQQSKEMTANESSSANQTEAERKSALATYEEKRLKNYEDGNRELERRRQLLREQEEREQKERDERDTLFESRLERKRELELQKQREEQERKKQMEIERILEKQRQIEQQKEEERKKLFEQREAARKEMERKSRLEWERQRMLELSTQKSRLLDQINDLKSREKAFELELESMDDTMQTNQTKISQIEASIHTIDESIAEIQRNTMMEKNLFDNAELQIKQLKIQSHTIQSERESLESSLNELNQSIEFGMSNREADQIKYLQTSIENMKQENIEADEQIATITDQCKEYQSQMEQLRLQLDQLEQEAKAKQPINEVPVPEDPQNGFANFDQFNTNITSNNLTNETSDVSSALFATPTTTSSMHTTDVDPFQTVDPFDSQSDLGTTAANNDWFQPTQDEQNSTISVDPFLPKVEPVEVVSAVASPKIKKAAPKANPNNRNTPKSPPSADPWGESSITKNTNGNAWAQFNDNSNMNSNSSFGTTNEWPQTINTSDEDSSTNLIQYQALYDYVAERPDELSITAGDIIIVDSSKQQDEHWLFGQIANDKQGFFPVVYAERMTSTRSVNVVDTTSPLSSESWVMTLAEYQGKTVDKHLSFQKGELILVREQKDTIWYSGQLSGKIGWFPRNYVRPATDVEIENNKNITKTTPTNENTVNSPSSNGQISNNVVDADLYEAIYAYDATDPSDLSFEVGERIIVLKRDGDWWTGRIGDRTGLFPNNYVQQVNTTQEIAIAIKPFQSIEEGRLSFDEGQTIYITNKDDKGWYQGEIRLPDQSVRAGWFPVECIHAQDINSPVLSNQNNSKLPQYIAIFPYEALQSDELSFPADAVLEILHEANTSGWFKARLGDRVGLIPSTYVQPLESSNQSSSKSCQISSNVIPCTPTTADSSQHPFCDNSTILSVDDSSTLITDTSSCAVVKDSSRISAIRELIETEQRYVNDLRVIANEFIKPLSNGRVLNDYEIEQLFTNWFSLIACNSVFLSTLEQQVQYKENVSTSDTSLSISTSRSISMSNISTVVTTSTDSVVEKHSSALISQVYDSPPMHQLSDPIETESSQRSDDNVVPQSSRLSSSMTINESTRIGEILCSYLPYMADTYFEYCNSRSQADKYLLSKIDLNEQFRSHVCEFQNKTGGLSLNGFLTKPIQRVTRYPLLIEKIHKHTKCDHFDYHYLQQAFECARQLTERINQQISEQENSLRLDWLQQHITLHTAEHGIDGYVFDELLKFNSMTKFHIKRQLLLHGLLIKVPSGRELITFLFNDFLLFSTVRVSLNNWQSQLFETKSNLHLKLYRLPFLLADIIIAHENPNDQLSFSIRTKAQEKPLILKTQQTNIRTLWVKTINNALENYQASDKTLLNDKASFTKADHEHQSKSPVARLAITILEARDLSLSMKTAARHLSLSPYCKITVGSLTLKTPYIIRTNNPKWNATLEFFLYDLIEDMIHINIFDNELFSPNENIGNTSMHLVDIIPCAFDKSIRQPSHTSMQTIYLNNGASLDIKCTLELFLTP